MKLRAVFFAAAVLVFAAAATLSLAQAGREGKQSALARPQVSGGMPLVEALSSRRSIRQFADAAVNEAEIGQLCWAAQGITEPQRGLRTAPSAGALYPIELYLVTAAGVTHYRPQGHALEPHMAGDVRRQLSHAAMDQESIGNAPLCFVITAVVQRTATKYGQRAERYCFMEAGHVAQNILLQATALRLAGVSAGAFEDSELAKVLNLPADCRPLYLVPIGRPAK